MLTDWLMVIITAIYVVATIFICVFNGKSAKAAHDQTEAARAQTKEMIDQYNAVNRPLVSIRFDIIRSGLTLGKGCLTHNDRSFIAENVDGNRSHLNVTYCNVPLKETYHKLFDEALEKYNAKQKRADRRIPDYYEKIRLSKQEKLFHEVIVQVGNFADMSAVGENGELAKRILDEYMQGFIKRNHTLHVFSAHLHMDEATPHLHIDFVPIVTNSKRGLETRVSLKQALLTLGFEGEGRENTEGTQWTESEKEHLAKVMARYGVRRIDVDKPHEHLPPKRSLTKKSRRICSNQSNIK